MRYLFIIQGEGRGHLTQALSLAGMLRRHGHEVVGALVGKSPHRKLPGFFLDKIGAPVELFDSPQFAFDRHNRGISMFRTLLTNASPSRLAAYERSMQLVRHRIESLQPDAIINFYELLASLAMRRFRIRVPMYGIGHQFLLGHRDYVFSRQTGFHGWLLRLHARMTACGCNELLGLSFRPMEDDPKQHVHVVPPLLRPEALEGEASAGDFILGYMVNNGFADEVRRWCADHPACRVHLFWEQADAPAEWQAEKGLTFHRLDDRLFLEYMRNCRGYITTAGFESVCEAMYHGKPMMLIPAHIEQRINAADAAATGAGIISDTFDLERFASYLKNRGTASSDDFRRWVASAEEHFVALLTKPHTNHGV